MTHYEEFLIHVKSHPFFEIVKKELLAHRPVLPAHDPNDDNTEQWKSLSAQQKGFDLCCGFFQITQE